ncbi:MAG: DUF6671 family protein [Acidiferrobacter sp.]
MDISGLDLGLASEGSFGADPYTGVLPWNIEMIVWIDDTLGIEVVGVAAGPTNFSHLLTADWEAVETFARAAGFPAHGIVIRPEHENDSRMRKDISAWEGLHESFLRARNEARNGCVFLETDGRAHRNPTRMDMISQAAHDLTHKLCIVCPVCGAPGFQPTQRIAGLPCRDCGALTQETQADVHQCARCGHQLTVARPEPAAPASRCPACNP